MPLEANIILEELDMKNNMMQVVTKVQVLKVRAAMVLADKKGENYVDTAVKILIAVVLGALLLAGLYALFNTTIMPTVTTKITELFSYNG